LDNLAYIGGAKRFLKYFITKRGKQLAEVIATNFQRNWVEVINFGSKY